MTFLFDNNDAANEGVRAALPLYDGMLREKFNLKKCHRISKGRRWAASTAATRERQSAGLGELGAQIMKIAGRANKRYSY